MEDILYDFYLADAIVDRDYGAFGNNAEKKKEFYNQVYKKHGVSMAEFDTSMYWYGQYLEKYLNICSRLEARYSVESDSLQAEITREEQARMFSFQMIPFWNYPLNTLLTAAYHDLNKLYIVSDSASTVHSESYELRFDVMAWREGMSADVSFSAHTYSLEEEKIFTAKSKINSKEQFSLPLRFPLGFEVRSLSCTIHLGGNNPSHELLIYNLGFYAPRLSVSASLPGVE